jgi:hypothetical protein
MMQQIISISGRIGSGKDTVADMLVNNHGFKRLSFASSLKDAVSCVFGWDRDLLEGRTKESREWRETVDPWWSKRLNIDSLTPRWVLQYWGTDVLRSHFHDDIWIASVEHKLIHTKENIVITDARFTNELNVIKSLGGTTIRIERSEHPEWYKFALALNSISDDDTSKKSFLEQCLKKEGIHSSEYSSVGYDYDMLIANTSSLDALKITVDSLVK